VIIGGTNKVCFDWMIAGEEVGRVIFTLFGENVINDQLISGASRMSVC